ncbi:MAG: cytochrome c biogenesis protein [Elusimicrobiota bacterium]|nr:MAG: cytochrome c biogenesis protein [Elusimicrobiota bacterium]
MAQTLLSWCAFFLYSSACAAAFVYLRNKSEPVRRGMLSLLGTGLTLHLLAYGARVAAFWAFPENRWFLPVNSFFGALSYLSLALAAAFFFIEARKKLGILGAFILPFVALGLGAALLKADPAPAPLAPELRSYWLNTHPMVLMTAYAAFANAFGVCLARMIQERQLKSRKPGACSTVCRRSTISTRSTRASSPWRCPCSPRASPWARCGRTRRGVARGPGTRKRRWRSSRPFSTPSSCGCATPRASAARARSTSR